MPKTLAYCLMPNHVHLILVSPHQGALSAVLSGLHRDYARRISFRERWRGYLWQGRFASFAMATTTCWPAHAMSN